MMKNKLPFVLAACLCAGAFTASPAQEFDFEDIDSLLEENTLTDVSGRYAAVLQNYLPERAARLGYDSAAGQLNARSADADGHAQRAFKNVRERLKDVHPANLSAAKQVDFELLQNAVDNDLRHAAQNRVANDPLYYAEAFDALYDVYLNPSVSPAKKRADLTARMAALTDEAQQAEKNLSSPSAFLAQLAMEKAYYAYLSFDELGDFLAQGAQDDFALAQTQLDTRNAKRAVKRMFDLFKRLSQEENGQDFRLGETAYAELLAQEYQIPDSPAKLLKRLEATTRAARQDFSAALEPFLEQTEAEDEVTLVEDLNGAPQAAAKQTASKKKKAKKGQPAERSAQDFYAVAKRAFNVQDETDYTAALQRQAGEWAAALVQNNVLAAPLQAVAVRPMPQYYTYTRAFKLRPSYTGGTPELLLRLPAGNTLARQEQLKRDFNTPALKLLTAKQLVPGGYYQNAAGKNWSVWRRVYPSVTTANGWQEYAAQVAKEQHLIVTDEELAYAAWDAYRRALAAELDVKLQTKRFSYTDALNYLMQENGFEQADAEEMLKELAASPGAAVSRQYGLELWQNVREKIRKKTGKKFNLADFHQKALLTGNVPPADVEKEINRLYEKDKKKKKDLF